jgi:hypothetical protein
VELGEGGGKVLVVGEPAACGVVARDGARTDGDGDVGSGFGRAARIVCPTRADGVVGADAGGTRSMLDCLLRYTPSCGWPFLRCT